MLCGFSKKEAPSYRVWKPKTRKVVESRNFIFMEIPLDLSPQPTRLSPLKQLPSVELDNNYASCYDLRWDA